MNGSRRHFVGAMLRSGAGLLSFATLGSMLGCASSCPPQVPSPSHRRRVLADLHVHPTMDDWNAQSPYAVQLPAVAALASALFNKAGFTWKTAHEARIDLLCATHFNVFDEWLSMTTDPNAAAPFNTHRMMNLLEQELSGPAAPYARLARHRGELEVLLQVSRDSEAYRVAVVHALEGGHTLGGNLDVLQHFARRGVALITITHFFNKGIATAANAFPFFPTSESPWPHQGLSAFGAEVVQEMERLGILVDVTHATATAMEDIIRISTRPLVATHASARTLGDHPYSLFDEHIQEIARRGGIVGILLYPYWLSNFSGAHTGDAYGALKDAVRTARYVSKICGTHKHIGIGSDFAGYISPPKDMRCLGEIDRLRGLLLEEFDHDEDVVEDIMANNVISFFLANWRSGT